MHGQLCIVDYVTCAYIYILFIYTCALYLYYKNNVFIALTQIEIILFAGKYHLL